MQVKNQTKPHDHDQGGLCLLFWFGSNGEALRDLEKPAEWFRLVSPFLFADWRCKRIQVNIRVFLFTSSPAMTHKHAEINVSIPLPSFTFAGINMI